ncbi:hypothetical protein H4Q26_001662 [Puccinia striiformis f. sp. tritici PST-130]|nr:hypothetical protein H4Q26_001662 [Puccinia striiformis f. sp. tritici PST-130]
MNKPALKEKSKDPKYFKGAMKSPQHALWEVAANEELGNIEHHEEAKNTTSKPVLQPLTPITPALSNPSPEQPLSVVKEYPTTAKTSSNSIPASSTSNVSELSQPPSTLVEDSV